MENPPSELGLSPEQREEMMAHAREFKALVESEDGQLLFGDLSIRTIGRPGETLKSSVTQAELQELRDKQTAARQAALSRFGRRKDFANQSAREKDYNAAVDGHRLIKYCDNPRSFASLVTAMDRKARSISLENAILFRTMLGDDVAMRQQQASAVWAKYGFPFVHIDDQEWGACLMATSVNKELADGIRAPWPAFRLAIPYGLISVDSEGGEPEPCSRVMALVEDDERWTLLLEGTSTMFHWAGLKTADLCDDVDTDEMNIADDPCFDLTSKDGRCMRLAARLVLSVCLRLDRSVPDRPAAKMRRLSKNRAQKRAHDPMVRDYVLGRPVVIKCDVRPAIRDYVDGVLRSSPTVQTCVRGHYKLQPCGPGNTERRYIHVEPYWRGPEDAPIAVRSHRIGR